MTFVEIVGVNIPASFRKAKTGRKLRCRRKWCLLSRNYIVIASFTSERKIDAWWEKFQNYQGRREFPALVVCELSDVQRELSRKESKVPNRPRRRKERRLRTSDVSGRHYSDPLMPWNAEYDMPEFDCN